MVAGDIVDGRSRKGDKMTAQPRTGPRPTMRDVAALAGVSTMTVSRVLRGEPKVAAEARERVFGAVRSLGYRRNENARGLRLGHKSGLVGLVVTNLANPFYSQLALGLEEAATALGMNVVLGNTGEDPTRETELVDALAARQPSGLVIVPAGHEHVHLSRQSLPDIPVVFATRPPIGVEADCVLVDDFTGAREATSLLIHHGHQRIAFLGNPATEYTGVQRFHGYCVALEAAGIPFDLNLVRRGPLDVHAAEAAASELLDVQEPPTAIFCTNNRNAVGTIRTIKRLDASTSLAAFDDFELADVVGVPLVVVSYDSAEVGRRSFGLLADHLRADEDQSPPAARRLVVPTTLATYGDLSAR